MNALTLGYEDDTTLPKREIARVQLVEAIALFLQGKFLCALTLAGAAESVLAGLLSADGQPSAVEESTARFRKILSTIGLQSVEPRKDSDHYKNWNRARNAVKHHGKGEPNDLKLNVFDEAYWMIERALENSALLLLPIENEQDFKNWIIVNINL